MGKNAMQINIIKARNDQSGIVKLKNSQSILAQSPLASNIPGHHSAIGKELRKASSGLMPHSNDSG